jgi:hypothetical protein
VSKSFAIQMIASGLHILARHTNHNCQRNSSLGYNFLIENLKHDGKPIVLSEFELNFRELQVFAYQSDGVYSYEKAEKLINFLYYLQAN